MEVLEGGVVRQGAANNQIGYIFATHMVRAAFDLRLKRAYPIFANVGQLVDHAFNLLYFLSAGRDLYSRRRATLGSLALRKRGSHCTVAIAATLGRSKRQQSVDLFDGYFHFICLL